jgi:hypothetical protein
MTAWTKSQRALTFHADRGAPQPRTFKGLSSDFSRAQVPGILKGWVDRSFLAGTAFKLPHLEPVTLATIPGSALIPGLTNIKQFGILTTFGATRTVRPRAPQGACILVRPSPPDAAFAQVTATLGDNGRNMWCRAVVPLMHPQCGVNWLGLYDMDRECARLLQPNTLVRPVVSKMSTRPRDAACADTTPAKRAAFLEAVRETYLKF